jgi:hypothetical protein
VLACMISLGSISATSLRSIDPARRSDIAQDQRLEKPIIEASCAKQVQDEPTEESISLSQDRLGDRYKFLRKW